ncbi:MAG: hypothetical protein CL570_05770 [Alphaproteobacteria bacterium]|nr:hypothetical protein [Alphaproteobacteria bacterium]HCQ70584.1 hypothetical protein [Rhodospirillaceae bacterium]|tara:strand:+ start:29106 stop:29720 length:615 start_codon:yes stop_codon:yes gene_type:complete
MTEQTHATPQDQNDDQENMYSAVGHLSTQLAAIERFVSRRFDEISMEINATSQQVDMAEEGIINKFSDILEVLKAISFSGDGKTPANAGVELDAVVDITEDATNRILDAASRSSELISSTDWTNEAERQQKLDDISLAMDEITIACSFQDITGQRIRTTLENLREIEDRLNNALEKMGIVVEVADPAENQSDTSSQGDIDALFD